MSIRTVGAGTTRDFSSEELDALNKDASTSASLNTARRNAGQRGDDVAVRGDDRTLDDKLAEKGTHMSTFETIELGAKAFELSGGLGLIPHAHGPAGAALLAAEVALPVLALVGVHVAMAEMQHMKTDLRDAATRDILHAGMLLSLELPSGFVDGEVGKLGVASTGQAPAKKVADQIKGTPLAASLQHHCDQGVHAAQDFAVSGKSKEQFFAAWPKVTERYNSDPAFRAGFDSMVWAAKNAPDDAQQMLEDVRSRDVRYTAAHIPVRISA